MSRGEAIGARSARICAHEVAHGEAYIGENIVATRTTTDLAERDFFATS